MQNNIIKNVLKHFHNIIYYVPQIFKTNFKKWCYYEE